MDFKTLIEKVSLQYEKKLPFVIFSKTSSETVRCYCQQNDNLYIDDSLSNNGFVLSPFDSRLESYLIPKNESESFETYFKISEIEKERVEVSELESDRIAYEEFISETIDTIQKGDAAKIVVSRKKDFQLSDFSIASLVERLFSAYPTAFRYVWFHPKTGIWCGATPEILVNIEQNKFRTMALAGTQPYTSGEITWRKKEMEEQHFVTEAILENLNGIVNDIEVSETRNHRAGSLLHLCTDISGKLGEEEGALAKIAWALHPTPAICGTPQKYARDYIIENEGYPREFYTGFLGPIEEDNASATLMVNLRCMKIENETASIFVGGGITADSHPEEEWKETQNKMQTMLQVLQPML
ncbi:isochorismate synthase [Aequorivita sp. H23M31]|uniref:isochorismate synthase n=1 Tax=Aequorivita ciconiae TaxID=2494375 RepID=A0A410FZS4_9FLAO|nr:isochorismate synthase [Aequorivita sp. H23M31]QAA80491.1 isochorismate synthase [Aequorivita sp. H23M31]